MKKLSKFTLNDQAEVLTKDEMKLIIGGAIYKCCCGMGKINWMYCYRTAAGSSAEAVNTISYMCNNGIGGCFLNN